jgi:hypothetical protein
MTAPMVEEAAGVLADPVGLDGEPELTGMR